MNRHLLVLISLFGMGTLWAQQARIPVDAYTPGNGIRHAGKNGYETFIQGYMQPYFETKSYTLGEDDITLSRFRMRRLRLRFQGESEKHKLGYRIQYDLSGNGEIDVVSNQYLLDAFVFYKPTKRTTIEIGKRATPADNRELWMLSQTTQFPERSRLTSAYAAIREVGIFANGRYRLNNGQYVRPYITLTTGDGDNLRARNYGGAKIGGRLDYLPFGLFTYFGQFRQVDMVREATPKLVVGVAGSYNKGMSSRRGRASGSILYLDSDLNPALPDYWKIGADFMFKYRGFSMIGEYVFADGSVPDDIVYRQRNDGSLATTFLVNGLQDPTNYVLGRMMLGRGVNLQAGYITRSGVSIDGRYTSLQPAEYSFLNNGTFYNRPIYLTASLGKYFERNYSYSIRAALTMVELAPGANDSNGNSIEGREMLFRLITTYAF